MGANRFTSILSQVHAFVKKRRTPFRLGLLVFTVDLDRWDPLTRRGRDQTTWRALYKLDGEPDEYLGGGADGADALASLLADLTKRTKEGA